ncbi:aprataxin-like [Sycon ciliatum]|uniref:aprataxin-like n=1 Tax=Sycon ciliatum TaxID=27933 RepID=UPI0031F64AEC
MARNHWSHALASVVKDKKMCVEEDSRTVTIKDGYPKAKHHYLVLPTPVQTRGVASLDKTDVALVQHMLRRGEELADRLTAKEPSVKFHFGFHSIPSMVHLHMHMISQDFDSPKLKNKKHWNSFTTEFFLDAEEVIEQLKRDRKVTVNKQEAEDLLKQDLTCPRCKAVVSNLPRMKDHYARCKASP